MIISRFNQFIVEKFGLSEMVIQQAKQFYALINKDKSKFIFNVDYLIDGVRHPIKIKIDSAFNQGGQFIPEESTPTIVLKDRSKLSTLTHELKHADRFFRMGLKAYEEDFTTLLSISEYRKDLSLFPYRFRNLFFLFYFLQKEEFEAHFHSDYLDFKAKVDEKIILDSPLKRKSEIMALWKAENQNYLAFAIYSGTLTAGKLSRGTAGNIQMYVPKEQKPFKFENWADSKAVDSVVWLFLQNKKNIQADESAIFKILKAIVPEHIIDSFDKGVPKKFRPMVQSYKAKLEKLIRRKMDFYAKKYMRIPFSLI